jgi:hypothetical protein
MMASRSWSGRGIQARGRRLRHHEAIGEGDEPTTHAPSAAGVHVILSACEHQEES